MNKSNVPITRMNKWFSGRDFSLEVAMGREALEGDLNFTVILYKVDRVNTQSDDIYGEGTKDGIRFNPPIELKVIPTIEKGENKAYNKNNGTGRNKEDGKLTFAIYEAQLTDKKTTIDFGDYIGYPVSETEIRYFSVADEGNKNFDNQHTIMGYKAAFRTVVCAPIDESEFRSL